MIQHTFNLLNLDHTQKKEGKSIQVQVSTYFNVWIEFSVIQQYNTASKWPCRGWSTARQHRSVLGVRLPLFVWLPAERTRQELRQNRQHCSPFKAGAITRNCGSACCKDEMPITILPSLLTALLLRRNYYCCLSKQITDRRFAVDYL